MYERFYGFRERPFDLTTHSGYLVLTDTHREALSTLTYGLDVGHGFTVLTGEAGTGKTTLIKAACARANQGTSREPAWAYMKNPGVVRTEFLAFLAARFGVAAEIAVSKTRLLKALEQQLLDGRRAALIVDDAQTASTELLEELRLMANMQSNNRRLLPVLLLGRSGLGDRLNDPALHQLKQQVGLRCTLRPLSLRETAAYIAGRIQMSGGEPAGIFTRDAVRAIYDRTGGIPRTISAICDNALLGGYTREQRPIDATLINTVGLVQRPHAERGPVGTTSLD